MTLSTGRYFHKKLFLRNFFEAGKYFLSPNDWLLLINRESFLEIFSEFPRIEQLLYRQQQNTCGEREKKFRKRIIWWRLTVITQRDLESSCLQRALSCWSLKWTTYGQNSNNSLIGWDLLTWCGRRSDVNNFDLNSFFSPIGRACGASSCFQGICGGLLWQLGVGDWKFCWKTFVNFKFKEIVSMLRR